MSMPSPVVTALMPVKHYHVGFLHEAVDSMLEQTRPDWRLLVIVEPREWKELSTALAGPLADPRIEMVQTTGRKLAGALNTGMRAARTDYVAILLSDDVWASDAVEVLARNIASHPEVDFFHSARRAMATDGEPISSVLPSREEVSLEDFASGTAPVKHLMCWRRDLALAIGGMDESLWSVGVDDFDFPWSMAEQGAVFKAIPDCLYVYRDHREAFRLTTHVPLSQRKRELRRMFRKHGMDSETIELRIAEAEAGYLRQCLYRNSWDRWVKRLRGFDVRAGWREPYP